MRIADGSSLNYEEGCEQSTHEIKIGLQLLVCQEISGAEILSETPLTQMLCPSEQNRKSKLKSTTMRGMLKPSSKQIAPSMDNSAVNDGGQNLDFVKVACRRFIWVIGKHDEIGPFAYGYAA